MIKCLECGSEMRTTQEDTDYRHCGLDNVILKGINVRRCTQCSESEIVIPHILGLHRELARLVVTQNEELTPKHIKFLRKHMGLSTDGLAERLNLPEWVICNWEKGTAVPTWEQTKTIKLEALSEKPPKPYRSIPVKMPNYTLQHTNNTWLTDQV